MRRAPVGALLTAPPEGEVCEAHIPPDPLDETDDERFDVGYSAMMYFCGFVNQRPKEFELFRVASEHSFGVPVDGEEKSSGTLNPLNHAVRGRGADRKTRRQLADNLMMSTGYTQLSNSENPGEV